MAKHKYVINKDGGYFYRFYPKLPKAKLLSRDQPAQAKLFSDPLPPPNPHEDDAHANVKKSIHGVFVHKYIEKDDHCIVLLAQAGILLVDACTNDQEKRLLSSEIHIFVSKDQYNYPFEKDKVYFITTDEIMLYEKLL